MNRRLLGSSSIVSSVGSVPDPDWASIASSVGTIPEPDWATSSSIESAAESEEDGAAQIKEDREQRIWLMDEIEELLKQKSSPTPPSSPFPAKKVLAKVKCPEDNCKKKFGNINLAKTHAQRTHKECKNCGRKYDKGASHPRYCKLKDQVLAHKKCKDKSEER